MAEQLITDGADLADAHVDRECVDAMRQQIPANRRLIAVAAAAGPGLDKEKKDDDIYSLSPICFVSGIDPQKTTFDNENCTPYYLIFLNGSPKIVKDAQ